MMRGALALLLGMEDDIEVVAQVAAGDAILDAALAHRPDVALLDIELPGRSGLDAAADLRIRVPDCRVLILTTFGRPGYLRRAIRWARCSSPISSASTPASKSCACSTPAQALSLIHI